MSDAQMKLEPKRKQEKWDQQPVPMERWGKDHWTTLLYLENVAVDHRGRIEPVKMRTSRRNWRLAGKMHGRANIMGKDEYPTRLKPTGAERGDFVAVDLLGGHDDWECMTDLRDAGLLTYEVEDEHSRNYPLKVIVKMTPKGRKAASEARERRELTGRATPD